MFRRCFLIHGSERNRNAVAGIAVKNRNVSENTISESHFSRSLDLNKDEHPPVYIEICTKKMQLFK